MKAAIGQRQKNWSFGMTARNKSAWGKYEIRTGKDGKPGIYTRDYNCRMATFNANTYALQQSLKELFDGAHKRAQCRLLRDDLARRRKTQI